MPPTVFIVSDGTGITAETFAHSILSQFDQKFRLVRVPFVDSTDKAHATIAKINEAVSLDGRRPIVFTTLVDSESNEIVQRSNALVLNMFQTFIEPLEIELDIKSTHAMGRVHQNADTDEYKNRIEAINFSLAHDDGQSQPQPGRCRCHPGRRIAQRQDADLLVPGNAVRRESGQLSADPGRLRARPVADASAAVSEKMFGLSIDPQRLAEIRNERRPGSKYAALENCRYEINEAEAMMKREGVKWLSSTHKSIEEIATTILQEIRLERPSYY